MKTIVITQGAPDGIGAEIISKTLSSLVLEKDLNIVLFGNSDLKQRVEKNLPQNSSIDFVSCKTSGDSARDSITFLDKAIEFCLKNKGCSLVTAPVNKNKISRIKKDFTGHTEYIAKMTESNDAAMTFITESIRLSLLTTHVGLKKVPGLIKKKSIISHVKLINKGLVETIKIDKPRIVICGLNPHASDEGLFGNEERNEIIPAVKSLKESGINIEGPKSAEDAFRRAAGGEYEMIISLFHDQILPGLKTAFSPTVNLTMGLPFIRTSPDHGPAEDLFEKEMADNSSFEAAAKLALKLSNRE